MRSVEATTVTSLLSNFITSMQKDGLFVGGCGMIARTDESLQNLLFSKTIFFVMSCTMNQSTR